MEKLETDSPGVLSYANLPQNSEPIYSLMMTWNVIGMFITLGLALAFLNSIGDAYGPMVGILFGIPASVIAACAFGLPTLVYLLNRDRKLTRSQALVLAAISFVPTAVPPVMTVLMITVERTHGSGC